MEPINGNCFDKVRIAYLDKVRIIACVLVVMVHISAQQIGDLPVDSVQFGMVNMFNCLSFSGVALFVMISGALALNPKKETGLKHLLVHKTIHFFVLYYIWKAFYQMVDMLEKGERFTFLNVKNDIVLALVQQRGYYHLWFLPMIAILYMAVPLVKRDVARKTVCKYFLCIFFVTALLVPTLFQYEFKFKYLLVDFFEANDFYLFGGYLGYFILGHYLHGWGENFTAKKRMLLYVSGCISFVLAFFLGWFHARSAGCPTYVYNTPFAVTTFFISAAIFVMVQAADKNANGSSKAGKILEFGAGCTFGVYLLHPLAIGLLQKLGIETSLSAPFLSIPLLTIATVFLCVPVTVIMSKLPGIRALIR